MEQQALALKYRPIDFDSLVGQEAVSRTLSLALESKRLSHAYLFSGLRGSGKTSSARIFARALQCDKGPSAKPCGECANCIAANPHKMRHIDIIELDGASNRKIDDIRELIEQTKYHPNMGRFKIFIIDEVHMLTREAFNALLKTLEEPPEYVKFILATTDPLKLPATILSRTQHFRFKRISDKNIFNHLKKILELEKIPHQDEAINMLIRSGSGSLRDTLTLLDQVIIYSSYNITAEACANMLGLINPQSLGVFFDSIFLRDNKALMEHLEGFFDYECEMLLDTMGIFLKDKLFLGNDERFSALIVDRFFRILSQAREMLSLGANENFILTLSVFKMLESLKVESIEKAILDLEKGFFESLPKEQKKQEIAQKAESIKMDSSVQKIGQISQDDSVSKNRALELFSILSDKVYSLNYDLGEIFEKNINFISFENNILTWESGAEGVAKERLINGYAKIKTFVQEIFGINTEIKVLKKEVKIPPEIPQTPPTQEKEAQEIKEIPPQREIAQEIPQESQGFNKNDELDDDDTPPWEEPKQTRGNPQPPQLQTTQANASPQVPQKSQAQLEVESALQSPLLKNAKELLEIRQIKATTISRN